MKNRMPRVFHNAVCKKATCCSFIAQSLYVD